LKLNQSEIILQNKKGDRKMKKLLLLLVLVFVFILTGCRENTEYNPENSSNDSVSVYTDSKTGCEYLIYASGYKGGITPRLGSDGHPICKKY
jgi:hypothetical protein